jgi:putative transposase
MRQFHRRNIRLPLERYVDKGTVWHVTMTALERQNVLSDHALATDIVQSLRITCANADASLLLYCAMPDHLHALIQIGETDLISIIRNFKSFTTRLWWKHGGAGQVWQRSAYDRGVRVPEYMDDLIAYVFNNPVEADEIERMIERSLLGGMLIEEGV